LLPVERFVGERPAAIKKTRGQGEKEEEQRKKKKRKKKKKGGKKKRERKKKKKKKKENKIGSLDKKSLTIRPRKVLTRVD